jgi:putative (di)nucleoside polyphosphate hydrolase
MNVIDRDGYRAGVGMIIFNRQRKLFWAKRVYQNAWQFPQGGMEPNEASKDAMFRELNEEVGLSPNDVRIVAVTHGWLRYDLPEHLLRHHMKPLCIGQKQKWYLLRLTADESHIDFSKTGHPEFDGYKWVDYWDPMQEVIDFKRELYLRALKIFAPYVLRRGKFRSYSKKSEPHF